MILIADSGSTKTDWCAWRGDAPLFVHTQGINPFHQKADEILKILHKELYPQLPVEPIESIFFYGAGNTTLGSRILRGCLRKVFGEPVHREVESDLLGAARSLC